MKIKWRFLVPKLVITDQICCSYVEMKQVTMSETACRDVDVKCSSVLLVVFSISENMTSIVSAFEELKYSSKVIWMLQGTELLVHSYCEWHTVSNETFTLLVCSLEWHWSITCTVSCLAVATNWNSFVSRSYKCELLVVDITGKSLLLLLLLMMLAC